MWPELDICPKVSISVANWWIKHMPLHAFTVRISIWSTRLIFFQQIYQQVWLDWLMAVSNRSC